MKAFQPSLEQDIPADRLKWQLEEFDNSIRREMKRALFLYVPQERSPLYLEPLKDWETAIKRFDKATLDIEEGLKCFALDRYGGAVFHMMLVAERGALEVLPLTGSTDPKPGWRSVTTALEKITQRTPYTQLTAGQQKHLPFFEQILPMMLSIQRAWRDKISHVDNRLVLLSGDFQAYVVEEIISATRAFMRRLAGDLPSEDK
jgi:hypothetical protein